MTADLDLLLRSTTSALRQALLAVLDDDVARARVALRGSGERRRLLAAAQDDLRAHPWVPAQQLHAQLQFVADLGRVADLVDLVARHVVAADDPVALTEGRRAEVRALLEAGEARLAQLRVGPAGPGPDPAYHRCGSTLFRVVDHASGDDSVVVGACGALAALLLQASRHASRVA